MADSAVHLREKAAHFRELARLIASERVERELMTLADDLEAKAKMIDAELASRITEKGE